jgi:hypothetical protein
MKAIQPATSDRFTSGYGEDQPLPQFSTVILVNSAILIFILGLAQSRRYPRITFGDLLLLGAGTHKLSRLIAKDRVTSPLRAPFTSFEKSIGSGEVEERARGSGWQRVLGELLSCPYCMSVWVAAGLMFLFILNPKLARLVCSLFTSVAVSHFLHRTYLRLEPDSP